MTCPMVREEKTIVQAINGEKIKAETTETEHLNQTHVSESKENSSALSSALGKLSSPDLVDLNPITRSVKTYIEIFFVGLLEGDGTITCNVGKTGLVTVRIIISLKNNIENLNMLNLIKRVVGGKVYIERKDQYVT